MSYSVATEQTPQLADYESWDVVWFFHPSVQENFPFPDPRNRLNYNYDWETIADQALAAGNVDGACMHAIGQEGFQYFDPARPLPPYTCDSIDYPRYSANFTPSHPNVVASGVTVDHLYRFVKAFRSRGMKVGFYIQEGICLNMFNYPNSTASARALWATHLIKLIKWLNKLYEVDFWWVDHPYQTAFTATQRDNLYQALKAPNGALVIHNSVSGINNLVVPCDIAHVEFNFPSSNEDFYLPATTVDAVNYYIPKGLAYTGLYTNPGGTVSWQAFSPNFDGTNTYNNVQTQAHFNQWYKYAKDRNLPFFCNMPVHENTLIPTYYDRVLSSNLIAS